jgi:hypothetical protein
LSGRLRQHALEPQVQRKRSPGSGAHGQPTPVRYDIIEIWMPTSKGPTNLTGRQPVVCTMPSTTHRNLVSHKQGRETASEQAQAPRSSTPKLRHENFLQISGLRRGRGPFNDPIRKRKKRITNIARCGPTLTTVTRVFHASAVSIVAPAQWAQTVEPL